MSMMDILNIYLYILEITLGFDVDSKVLEVIAIASLGGWAETSTTFIYKMVMARTKCRERVRVRFVVMMSYATNI